MCFCADGLHCIPVSDNIHHHIIIISFTILLLLLLRLLVLRLPQASEYTNVARQYNNTVPLIGSPSPCNCDRALGPQLDEAGHGVVDARVDTFASYCKKRNISGSEKRRLSSETSQDGRRETLGGGLPKGKGEGCHPEDKP